MITIRIVTLGMMILSIFSLSACCTGHITKINLIVKADDYINPNMYLKAAPVELNFYTLTTPIYFNKTNFDALEQSAAAALHGSLVSKKRVSIRPSQRFNYVLRVSPSAHNIGITAGFRDLNHARWRWVMHFSLLQKKWYKRFFCHAITLYVILHTQQLNVHMSQG